MATLTSEPRVSKSLPANVRRRLRGDLDNIVLKAMRKEPDRRYISVEQFSQDICQYLQGKPVSAAPDSFLYRSKKFVRRHKFGAAAAVLIVLAVTGGVFATLRQARIAATNEKRAEARFNDVRALANSLLFDIHDSIADLPGATLARQLLINRAVEYLDSLSQEANGDSGLQRELAAAYQRLGDVQGQPRAAALGDSGDALKSYLKALQLREILAQSRSVTDEDKLQLGEMHRVVAEMLHFSGDLKGTLEHAREAVRVGNSITDKGSDRRTVSRELARAYKTLAEAEWSGMAFGSLAEQKTALNDYRRALAIVSTEAEGDPVLTRQREFLHLLIGRTLAQNGLRAEGIQELRSVLSYFRSVGAASNSSRSQRDLSEALEELGLALQRDGRFQEALSCHKEVLTLATKLLNADTSNLQARFDSIGPHFFIGVSLLKQGKLDDGLHVIQRAIPDQKQLITLDPGRPEYRTWLAVFRVKEGEALMQLHRDQDALSSFEAARELYDGVVQTDPLDMDERLSTFATDVKIADALLKLGHSDRARQTYKRAIEESEPLTVGDDPKQQAQYSLADSYAGLGDVSFSLAAKTKEQKNALSADACSWYEKSLHVWHVIPNSGWMSPNGFDTEGPTKVKQQLALLKCGAK